MTVFKEFKFGGKQNPLGSFGPIIILVLGFVALYFFAKAAFTVLSFIAPVLLILALILDYTVITDYVKFIWKMLRENPLYGIVAIILSFLGFPIVSGFLALRAYLRRRTKTFVKQQQDGKYIDYEEVTEEEDFLELPEQPVKVKKKRDDNNEYNDLFD